MIAVAPVVAQSSRNFLEMNSMLCVSGQKKFCEDKPKIRKVIDVHIGVSDVFGNNFL